VFLVVEMFNVKTVVCACVTAAARGRGRGRGRGRPLAAAADVPAVGLEANVMADSPSKPAEAASVGPQRPGRGKASSQDTIQAVGHEPTLPEALKVDASLTETPPKQQRTGAAERRVIEANDDNIVISINNTDTDAVASAAAVSQKPPKIGSGRLSQAEAGGSGRKPRGKRGKGHSVRTTAAEEPVTIGIAVIRTPSDKPDVDETPKLKGILKQSARERHDDWVEETVEKVDWEKEIKEAQRRKAEMTSNESIAITIKNDAAGHLVKETDVDRTSAVEDDVADGDDDDDDDDDEWEDVDDEDDDEALHEDVHDISAESFDQFIKEHTLKLDVELAAPDIREWTVKEPSGSITAGSDDSFLKTPVGQTRVVDWGAEMDELSQSDRHRMSVELGNCYTLV